jgi:uncharacterized integral membrane protein (TIGR00698 family)
MLRLLPGIGLAVAVMLGALPLAERLGRAVLAWQGIAPEGKSSPVSGVSLAILLGFLLRNACSLPAWLQPGVQFSVAKLLRLGIILVGIKLTFLDVLKLGAWGVPIVATTIALGLLIIHALSRQLGLPTRLGTLLAAGTSICGVTAVVSTAPAIKADEREVAYAVATITLFGLLGMLIYPNVAPLLLTTPEQVGVFLGTAVHDTSQVVGAALMYKELHHEDAAFKTATVIKLTRNLFLVVVVPLVALWHARGRGGEAPASRLPVTRLLPAFVLGFVALAIVRSVGDATAQHGSAFGMCPPALWQRLTTEVGEIWGARYLLGTAMAAVGLSTSVAVFRRTGLRPLIAGFTGALLVGAAGLAMARWLGPHVRL